MAPGSPGSQPHIVFYDGVCGLCDRFVRFIVRRDRARKFRFAALQSELAARELATHGVRAADLDTVYVLAGGRRLLRKSRAVLFVLAQLGGVWWVLSLARVVPAVISDRLYALVASVRYRVFGRLEACRVPTSEERTRFLDAAADGAGPPA
jgi:predicted DCC family thiol-disulfide oxidoreductase YuxK